LVIIEAVNVVNSETFIEDGILEIEDGEVVTNGSNSKLVNLFLTAIINGEFGEINSEVESILNE